MLEEVRRASETENKGEGEREVDGGTDRLTDLLKAAACVSSVVCSPVSSLLGTRTFQKLSGVTCKLTSCSCRKS